PPIARNQPRRRQAGPAQPGTASGASMCALTELRSSPSRALAMDQEQAQIVRQISGLSEISDRYDAILCDIWGVLHNGVASFAQASDALVSFRAQGGAVILISNAQRPSPPMARQLL